MSYESMNQTADLLNSLELGMVMAEHGMIGFSVGVARVDGVKPQDFMLLTMYDMHGQALLHGRAVGLQCYCAIEQYGMNLLMVGHSWLIGLISSYYYKNMNFDIILPFSILKSSRHPAWSASSLSSPLAFD